MLDWGIILGVIGAVGVGLSPAILGATIAMAPNPTAGEFRFIRVCFIFSACLLTVGTFTILWLYQAGPEPMRLLLTAAIGAIVFGGLAAGLDWANKKQTKSQPSLSPVADQSPKRPEPPKANSEYRGPPPGVGIGIVNFGTNTTINKVKIRGFERGIENYGDGLNVENSDIKGKK